MSAHGRRRIALQATVSLLVMLFANTSLVCTKRRNAAESEGKRQEEFFQRPGVQVSEIVRARGYTAEVSYFITDDGYKLAMTRATNPLISSRRRRRLQRPPLLFIHGTLVDANSFVTNSFEIRHPKDFSRIKADHLSERELIRMFSEEPSAKSLAFFALDFGHEVWFLHRRGAPLSQSRVKLPRHHPIPPTVIEKFHAAQNLYSGKRKLRRKPWRRNRRQAIDEEADPETNSVETRSDELTDRQLHILHPKRDETKLVEVAEAAPKALLDDGHLAMDIEVTRDKSLWNHSFDEQAAYDIPNAVDYVLERTGHERLAIVGDSSGGALLMMSLILEPGLNEKLSKAIAWVPSFNIGHHQDNQTISRLQVLFDYIGPYPPTFLALPIQALMEFACSLEVLQVTVCTPIAEVQLGKSNGDSQILPEFQSHYLTPVSAHEYLHLIQMMTKRQTRMFDFRDTEKNLIAYGQREPPYYNVSLINFDYLSIYVGTSDDLVTLDDVRSFQRELNVPHRVRVLNQPGVNHAATKYHKNVSSIFIIPTYKDIISNGYRFS